MEDEPTCDLCGDAGYCRYMGQDSEWITTCAAHRPLGNRNLPGYHTVHHDAWPAENRSAVQNPNAFIRAGRGDRD